MAERELPLLRAEVHRLARGLPPVDPAVERALVQLSRTRPQSGLPRRPRTLLALALFLLLTLPTVLAAMPLALTPVVVLRLVLDGSGAALLGVDPALVWRSLLFVIGAPWFLYLVTGGGMLRAALAMAEGTAGWRRDVAAVLQRRAFRLRTGAVRVVNVDAPKDWLAAVAFRARRAAAGWEELREEEAARRGLEAEIRAAPVPGALPAAGVGAAEVAGASRRAAELVAEVEAARRAMDERELLGLEELGAAVEDAEITLQDARRKLGLAVRRQAAGGRR